MITRTVERLPTRVVSSDRPPAGIRPLGFRPDLGRRSPDPNAVLGPPPPTDRLRGWLVTATLTAVAGLVRFTGLGHPTDHGTPVFDEKYYAPQAWQMLRNGGFEDNPGFELVVHPPLGKQLIALGELAFGYDGFGWRAASALAGTLTVLLVVRVGRRLTRSTLLGGLAGVLLVCDGLSHVQSRIGMLDSFSAFFVLAAFAAVLCDRDDVRARMAVAVGAGRVDATPFGPRLGVRWWRLLAGALLGWGCAVKWSGTYWVAAFALLVLLWDVSARRTAGARRPWIGTLRRDLGPALWALAAVPLLAYLSAWWAWFSGETAVDRFVVGTNALASLGYYSAKVLEFHSGLTTAAGGPHPWESKPWAWPMGLRPMLYHYDGSADVTGCGANQCISAVMPIGTPALWWPALLVLGFGLWRLLTRFDGRFGAVLLAYAAGILPWFANMSRQMYFFYMTPLAPFLVLATVLAMGMVLGPAGAGRERRLTGLLVASLWTATVVANFRWLWPILVGAPMTPQMWESQLWLPSWHQ